MTNIQSTEVLQTTAAQTMVREILRQPEHSLSFIKEALDTVGLEHTNENIDSVTARFFTYLHTLEEAFGAMLEGLEDRDSH